jgi:hypothetical protein
MSQLVTAVLVFLCIPPLAAPQSSPDHLVEFLQNYVGEPTEQTKTTRYSAAFVDLKDDGVKEVIVYLSSNYWCGTGGCTMLILAPEGTSYRVVTKTMVTRLPIRILATKSNGWHDISIVARIKGVEPLYEAILPFDGKTYPISPSVAPAHRLNAKVAGKIVIPLAAKEKLLYQ